MNILIIDNERTVREFLADYLQTIGDCRIALASDSSEAARRFEAGDANIILLDLQLDGDRGLELLKGFIERGGTFEVVAMASNSRVEDALTAIKYGAYDFVFKPFDDLDMLERSVRRAMDTVLLKMQNEELLRELTQKNLEMEIANKKLERLTSTDDLTGLYNMRYMNEYVPREIMRCERYGRTFALIITDMDNLKSINDRNGHLAGSGMLREVGKAIASAVRRTDIVARFGGDEFLVLADQVTGETALLLAERIRASVESIEMEFNDRIIRTTTSVGVACYPQHGRDYQELFAEADRMMYKAKTGGKNRVELAKTEPKGK